MRTIRRTRIIARGTSLAPRVGVRPAHDAFDSTGHADSTGRADHSGRVGRAAT